MIPIVVVFAGTAFSTLPSPGGAQELSDLLERDRSTSVTRPRHDRNRTDLALSADVVPLLSKKETGHAETGFEAELGLEFVCGRFDLRGTFRNLMKKEMREEFLEGLIGYAESELVGSGMELLCQAQPTLCTLLQNHNIAANLKLGYHYDRCRAIEDGVLRGQKSAAAAAIESCLKEKEAAGVPLDRALEACRRPTHTPGFSGELVREFRLTEELGKHVHLSTGARELVETVADSVRLTGRSASSRPDPDAFPSLHERVRREYLENLARAVRRARTTSATAEELEALTPPGSPPLSNWHLVRLARLPAHERHAALASLASTFALATLTHRIHEAERALEGVLSAPTLDEAQKKDLAARIRRLRKERVRLAELYDDQRRTQDAQRRVHLLLEERFASELVGQVVRERGSRHADRMLRAGTPWGRPAGRVPPRAPGGSQPSRGRSEGIVIGAFRE